MSIFRLLASRILLSALTLFLVSILIFLILEALPGDVATRILGREATAKALEVLRSQLHLDQPALVRYFQWLGDFLRGDLGTSMATGRPIADVLGPRIANTLLLSLLAFAIYLVLALVPAIVQAVNRGKTIDNVISVITLLLLSLPDFLLATMLLFLFAVAVPILPALATISENSTWPEMLRAMVLPAVTLAIMMAVYAIRVLRDSLIEVLRSLEPVAEGRAAACMRWQEAAVAQMPVPVEKDAEKAGAEPERLLSIADLALSYERPGLFDRLLGRTSPAVVRDIDLDLRAGEVVALVGESGSGKSTIARAISGRLPPRGGTIRLDGAALAPALEDRTVEDLRQIQYIFQNPDASLNPRRRIRAILERPIDHFGIEIDVKALETVVENVGLHAGYLDRFPEQLSGGERQRIAIARALLVNPKLLICDEILSALDVSVQAKIVELLRSLKEKHGVAMLFISHDLAVVQEFADRVAVLYRGELMQLADTATLLCEPLHPYTDMLLEAAPGLRKDHYISRPPTAPASKAAPGIGCPLAGRCPRQLGSLCSEIRPPVQATRHGFIRCHLATGDLATRASPAKPDVSARQVTLIS